MKCPCEGISILFKQVCDQSIWHHLPSKDEEGPLDVIGHPEGSFLSSPLSQPVIEAKVLVNQEASHLFSLGFKSGKRSPQENGCSLNGFSWIRQFPKITEENPPA